MLIKSRPRIYIDKWHHFIASLVTTQKQPHALRRPLNLRNKMSSRLVCLQRWLATTRKLTCRRSACKQVLMLTSLLNNSQERMMCRLVTACSTWRKYITTLNVQKKQENSMRSTWPCSGYRALNWKEVLYMQKQLQAVKARATGLRTPSIASCVTWPKQR